MNRNRFWTAKSSQSKAHAPVSAAPSLHSFPVWRNSWIISLSSTFVGRPTVQHKWSDETQEWNGHRTVGGRLLPYFKPDRDHLVNRTSALPSVRKFLTTKTHWTLMSIYCALKRWCFWKTGLLPRASRQMLSHRDPQAESLVEVLCGLPAQDSPPPALLGLTHKAAQLWRMSFKHSHLHSHTVSV